MTQLAFRAPTLVISEAAVGVQRVRRTALRSQWWAPSAVCRGCQAMPMVSGGSARGMSRRCSPRALAWWVRGYGAAPGSAAGTRQTMLLRLARVIAARWPGGRR